MGAAVEQVVQTANMVLTGHLAPREAVTILVTLARDAVPAARQLRAEDPATADDYRELVLSVGSELRRMEAGSDDPRHLRSMIDDLAQVLRALG